MTYGSRPHATDAEEPPRVLEVSDLSIDYGRGRATTRVVDGVDFHVAQGEVVALVGESGSGKTTIGRAVMGALAPAGGQVILCGRPVSARNTRERRVVASDVQMVFQDPYGSLNPARPVAASIGEPLVAQGHSRGAIEARVEDLIARVGLPKGSGSRYPSHFSGGERQRISIARALSVSPRLLVCDEPTSALDVSTQRRVLDLLLGLRGELGLSLLFITHDLAVVQEIADRVLVLRRGEIVEEGSAFEVCARPRENYTRELVSAVPVPNPVLQRERRMRRLGRQWPS